MESKRAKFDKLYASPCTFNRKMDFLVNLDGKFYFPEHDHRNF